MKKTMYTLIVSICLILAATVTAQAQAGSLDLTFGSGGKVTTDFVGLDDKGYAVAIQSNQKIVVAGQSDMGSGWEFALVRYNSDGTLDITFDFDGKVTTGFGGAGGQGYSVAIQSNDKIVVAGQSYNGTNWDFALVRYNSDGSLDNTFGSGGIVITDFASSNNEGESIAIQSDDKIVVAGANYNGTNDDFALVRYNSNGSLDNTFGTGGKVTTDFGASFEECKSVTLQTDDKIVGAGYSNNGVDLEFALTRYNSDGSLDNTFGSGGMVTTSIGGFDDEGLSVKIQDDDKIVVAGTSYNGTDVDFALVRYNSNGTLDNTFGTGGKVTTAIGSLDDDGSSVVIQSNHKILVAGWSYNSTDPDFALVRYNSDGTLDNTFGSGGKVITAVGSTDDYGWSVALQGDGKIVVAGISANGGNTDFAVVRYNNDIGIGISETGPQSAITVSPNPFTDELTIKWDEGQRTRTEKEIILFTVMGKELMREKTFEGETRLITSDLASGIYLLNYTDGNKTTNIKLIKL